MTTQHRAMNTTASVPYGGTCLTSDACRYKSSSVDPNNVKYSTPSCNWVACITPEFPASIVSHAIPINRPITTRWAEAAFPARVGPRMAATPRASATMRPARATNVSAKPNSRTRKSLPCWRATNSPVVIERSQLNAISRKSSNGPCRTRISCSPSTKEVVMMIAGHRSPFAPQVNSGTIIAIFSA